MKLFAFLLTMTFSFSLFAKDTNASQTQSLLKLLMENSATVKVVSNLPGAAKETLSEWLSSALNPTANNNKESAAFAELSSKCVSVTPRGVLGANTEKCDLIVLVNSYSVQTDGSLVKDGESSYDFSFETVTPVVPHPVRKLNGPVTVTIAD